MKEFTLTNNIYEAAFSELKALVSTDKITTYVINFKSEFSNSKIIRDFVGEIFDAFEIIHPWRGRFILITDELINNAIEHGSKEDDMNLCIITAGKDELNEKFHIILEVHDTGKGKKIQIEKFDEIKKENAENQEKSIYMGKRGRGLFHITEKIVDRLSFSQSEK